MKALGAGVFGENLTVIGTPGGVGENARSGVPVHFGGVFRSCGKPVGHGVVLLMPS